MRLVPVGWIAACLLIVGACARAPSGSADTCEAPETQATQQAAIEAPLIGLKAELVVDGLDSPVDVLGLPGSDLLFVVEKPGRVVVVDDGRVIGQPFLDIKDRVLSERNEQGLLTVKTHPDFDENCLLYLFFTDVNGDSQLVEVEMSGISPPSIDVGVLRRILEIPQKQPWHQSGSMVFGPEGYLWVSIGDGGGIGDPDGHGQNPHTLKGTILRLDLDGRPYGVPPDNPFVGSRGGRVEVWAFGLRNPWRISIDSETRLMYLPDVGQAEFEELNVVPLSSDGGNFGWSITEGPDCFQDIACDPSGFVMPVYHYLHGRRGCAIIGGSVYRGRDIPELHGQYFFADFCEGSVRSLTYEKGGITSETDWGSQLGQLGTVTSFGVDNEGELYVTNLEGELWKIVPVRESERPTS